MGSEEKKILKEIQSLSNEKTLALNMVAKLEKQIKTLKAELQEARNALKDKSEQSSATAKVTVLFRNEPATLSEADVKAMLKKHGFFDSSWNKDGHGFKHQFEVKTINGDKIVIDQASGLMWQQSGSPDDITYDAAKKYTDDLNKEGFVGYKDWRLPTLEEAMSLLEPEMKKHNLFIDPIFDTTQRWIWTSDSYHGAAGHWVGGFDDGGCVGVLDLHFSYVRAVRFG